MSSCIVPICIIFFTHNMIAKANVKTFPFHFLTFILLFILLNFAPYLVWNSHWISKAIVLAYCTLGTLKCDHSSFLKALVIIVIFFWVSFQSFAWWQNTLIQNLLSKLFSMTLHMCIFLPIQLCLHIYFIISFQCAYIQN
jgi:hypothetical protein